MVSLPLLIDEYDYPLLNNIGSPIISDITLLFSDFYSVLKDKEDIIRFSFITGITKIAHVSLFSKLNNLRNISNDASRASICGYTDEEIDCYFKGYLEQCYRLNKFKREEEKIAYRNKIRSYYDGYRFSQYSKTQVYNPVSVGLFFIKQMEGNIGFTNHWIDTGASKLVKNLIARHKNILSLSQPWSISEADSSLLEVGDIMAPGTKAEYVYAYLYQAGYLTISGEEYGRLYLSYPNEEVSSSMIAELLKAKYGGNTEPYFVTMLRESIREENIEKMIKALNLVFSSIPWRGNKKSLEETSDAELFLLLKIIGQGMDIKAEEETSGGNSDLVIICNNLVYVIELKVNKTAKEALDQIKENGYADSYKEKGNIIHLIGINFSSRTRNIESWKEEILNFC